MLPLKSNLKTTVVFIYNLPSLVSQHFHKGTKTTRPNTQFFWEKLFFKKKIDVFGSHFAHPHFPCITSIQLKFFPSHPLRVSRILSVWFVFCTKRFDWNWIIPNVLRACVCDAFKLFFPLKTDKKPRSTKYSLTLIVR